MFAGLRELPKYHLVEALGAVRQQLAAVGAELAAAGAIDAADDIFFLDLADAHRGLGGAALQGLVARRREAYAAELGRRHIPRVLLSDGTEPEAVQITRYRPQPAEGGRRVLTAARGGSPAHRLRPAPSRPGPG